MRQRPIDSAPTSALQPAGSGWQIVGAVIVVIALGVCGVRADSGAACGTADPTAPSGASISIGEGHPRRHADPPGIPREALTETEHSAEDVEPDGGSTYSWPAGTASRRFTQRADGDCRACGRHAAPLDPVDLTALCRLLV